MGSLTRPAIAGCRLAAIGLTKRSWANALISSANHIASKSPTGGWRSGKMRIRPIGTLPALLRSMAECLVLVEAKAHANELKPIGKPPGNLQNHDRIALAISDANMGLAAALPGWQLSRDSHYQIANRFAWAWM